MKDASSEGWWLAEKLAAMGYIVVVVLALFGGRGRCGRMLLYARPNRGGDVLCRWRRTLLVAVAEAIM